jgi:thioredoxin reductase
LTAQRPITCDVLIVGGGPAGLSAALVLGRARRCVVVCDAGQPRNWAARAIHGYLTRDGVAPAAFRRTALRELQAYDVRLMRARVAQVSRNAEAFRARLDSGARITTRKVILATGVSDKLPNIRGLRALYGRGVHHCPYCDAWELRDRPLAALGTPRAAIGLALALRGWSPEVWVCTNGSPLSPAQRRRLDRMKIRWREELIAGMVGARGRLTQVVFRAGDPLRCAGLFFNTGQVQRSGLPRRLGCRFDDKGGVRIDARGRTNIPGLYLAGDASREVQFAITAAADGARAAVAVNAEMQREDRAEGRSAPPGRGGASRRRASGRAPGR